MVSLVAALILTHSWYPHACCEDKHCHPTPCDGITETKDGYDYRGTFFPPILVHPSKDALCHVCVAGNKPLCLFIQMNS